MVQVKTNKFWLFIIFSLFTITAKGKDLNKLLPQNNTIHGWQLADTIKSYKSDQLFTYMDGGAEIFMEYGFKQLEVGQYIDKDGHHLQVEIFEMTDSAAAYGIYTFYLNGEGKTIQAGQEGTFIDYYGVARKGNILVVVSVPVITDPIKLDIEKFATYVCNLYTLTSGRPELVTRTEKFEPNSGYIKFMVGKIGLSNVYKFIPGNSFVFNQATSFEKAGIRVIIMTFESQQIAQKQLNDALTRMKKSNSDGNYVIGENYFEFADYKKNTVYCETLHNFLFITIGQDKNQVVTSRKGYSKF
jgi:hypothetical protein